MFLTIGSAKSISDTLVSCSPHLVSFVQVYM
jgi:hypothetical protein